MNERLKNRRKLWDHPWGYNESFVIGFAILFIGFIIEYISDGAGFKLFAWPNNLYVLLVFVNILVLSHFLFPKHPIVRWLGQIPASISSISIFTILILLMGFTNQQDSAASEFIRKIGLSHVTRSWPYLLVSMYFLVTLGFVTLRKTIPLKKKNLGFLLNHLGLFIIIIAGSLGTGDLMKLQMHLNEGESTYYARDHYGNTYEMPFSIKLNNFHISEYPAKVAVVDIINGGIAGKEHESYFEIEENYEGEVGATRFKILKYLPDAVAENGQYVEFIGEGSAPAALIGVYNQNGDSIHSGWICSGNAFQEKEYFAISSKAGLIMMPPVAKEYSSDVEVTGEEGKAEYSLLVNKPISTHGWKVYQVGYDERYGKHSKLSIVEVVRDPWLPVVYLGIFMVIAGAIYIFWIGRKEKIN